MNFQNHKINCQHDVFEADAKIENKCINISDCFNTSNSSLGAATDGTQSFGFVEFKGHRRELFLNHNNIKIKSGDKVVVTAESGFDLGKVLLVSQSKENEICKKFNKTVTKTIVNKATEQDLDKEFSNRESEKNIVSQSNIIVQSFALEMKIIDAEWQFDRQKLTIFFTAQSRIDFRELVKELARQFKTRIELRQISAREETKRIGNSVGCCGKTLCCTSFLSDFNKVTAEHAKVQLLSTNSSKLSGNCRQLKCCMAFEYENYKEELEKYPELNSTIETKTEKFLVSKIDIYKKLVTLFNENIRKFETVDYETLQKIIKDGKIIPPAIVENKKIIIDDDVVLEDDI